MNSKDFGVPQNRERIYIVCFRNDIAPEKFDFPEPLKKKTCLRDILEEAPIPSKYYLSDVYVETLKRHKAHHQSLGHGFGKESRASEMDGIEIHDMLPKQIRRDGKYVAEDGKHRK